MEAALLIASLSLLVGMVAQLARLPRRRRAAARRAAVPRSFGAAPRGGLVGLEQAPTVE
jgi:hypothetical protein